MKMDRNKRPIDRPKNLNLLTIRLPMPAFVSIMHRISGALLFLLLPLILWVLHLGFAHQETYEMAKEILHHPIFKLFSLFIFGAYSHHACAGIRHLALDAHLGLRLNYARASSGAVLVVSGLLTLVMGFYLW
jgi:succinate dehydrogenase / fumarate reductase, cytochrome b subunit